MRTFQLLPTLLSILFCSVLTQAQTQCGPPSYGCSTTSLSPIAYPSPIPSVGNLTGANTIVTPTDFNNRIVRVTDAKNNPAKSNFSLVTSGGGSADWDSFNLGSTLLVLEDTGGSTYPFSFNPQTMQASRLYISNFPSTGGMVINGPGGFWSRAFANRLYRFAGRVLQMYDFSDLSTPASAQTVFDFGSSANCLGSGYTATWKSEGGSNEGDTIIAAAFSNTGAQGTGVNVAAYVVGKGCAMLNTSTGVVTADPGFSGYSGLTCTSTGCTGTIGIPDRITIHNVKISKDGEWLVVARENCTSGTGTCNQNPFYYWQIGTTTVNECPAGSNSCSGHWTEGFKNTWIDTPGSPQLFQTDIRQMSNPTVFSQLIPAQMFPANLPGNGDIHWSWNNVDGANLLPVFATTYDPNATLPAWMNEIVALNTDGSGVMHRFAHTYASPSQTQNFNDQFAIGQVSKDGRFFIWTSDWLGTLGSTSGATTCTLGTNCRSDVFIVALQ